MALNILVRCDIEEERCRDGGDALVERLLLRGRSRESRRVARLACSTRSAVGLPERDRDDLRIDGAALVLATSPPLVDAAFMDASESTGRASGCCS